MSIGTTAALAIGVGAAGVAGAGINAAASGSAAKTESNAELQAAQLQQQTTQQELAVQQQEFNTGQQNLAPYLTGGSEGLSALETGLGVAPTGAGTTAGSTASGVPSGSLLSTYPGGAFTAPTADQAAATPGEQFELDQGLQGVQRADASTGAFGGASEKDAANYAEGLASTNYQQAYNNALNTYGTNYATWLQNQQTKLGSLEALAGQGYSAATGSAQLGATAANSEASTLQSGANNQINALTGAANAQAAGTVGVANSLSSLTNLPTSIAAYNYLNGGSQPNQNQSSYLNAINSGQVYPGGPSLPGSTYTIPGTNTLPTAAPPNPAYSELPQG